MKPPLSHAPLLPVFAGLCVGIVSAWFLNGWLPVIFWLGAAIMLFIAKKLPSTVFACSGIIGWIAMWHALPSNDFYKQHNGEITLEGIVEHAVESNGGTILTVSANKTLLNDSVYEKFSPQRILLTFGTISPRISAGDKIRFATTLNSPIAETDLPDEFDPSTSYRRQGIAAIGFVAEDKLAITGKSNHLKFRLRRLRESINNHLFDSGLSESTALFLSATLLGDTGSITSEMRNDFSAAGVAHVLALSGAHVAIIAFVMSLILFPFSIFGFHNLRYFSIVAMLWIYALVTGFSPSVTRSVLMITFTTGAYIFGRRNSAFNALLAAGTLILIFEPTSFLGASFQFSFLAVASILLFNASINSLKVKNRFIFKAVEAVTLPFVAMLATAPLAVYYFHIFPVYFMLGAIPVSLALSFLLADGIVIIACSFTGIGTSLPVLLANECCQAMFKLISAIVNLPGAVITGLHIGETTVAMAMLLFPIVAGLCFYRRRAWVIATVAVIAATVWSIFLYNPIYTENELYITRRTRHTDIVIKQQHELFLVSTAPVSTLQGNAENASRRYADYMSRRGIDSIKILHLNNPRFFVDNNLLKIGNKHLYIVADNSAKPNSNADYAVICRGFRGDVRTLADSMPNTSFILARDLNAKRHHRYLNELLTSGRKVFSLRDAENAFRLEF